MCVHNDDASDTGRDTSCLINDTNNQRIHSPQKCDVHPPSRSMFTYMSPPSLAPPFAQTHTTRGSQQDSHSLTHFLLVKSRALLFSEAT
mmetsp:Transcript_15650/g.44739  ORF Transcript_15650/g.44739 Transcript_15650/m.44739 type:complete len:89 (+) Transcript_15650:128-394(+)